jgi:hypothetical protein
MDEKLKKLLKKKHYPNICGCSECTAYRKWFLETHTVHCIDICPCPECKNNRKTNGREPKKSNRLA